MMDAAIYFRRPNSILMLVMAISLFMVFKECSLNGGKLIPFLSSCTLGIYMAHGGRSGQFWWNRIFHNPAYEGTWMVFADAFCALVIIMCTGVAIEFVRQKIENYLKTRKINRKQEELLKQETTSVQA
jgi:surface polysaccharide O-acyltransferase-like enzyme